MITIDADQECAFPFLPIVHCSIITIVRRLQPTFGIQDGNVGRLEVDFDHRIPIQRQLAPDRLGQILVPAMHTPIRFEGAAIEDAIELDRLHQASSEFGFHERSGSLNVLGKPNIEREQEPIDRCQLVSEPNSVLGVHIVDEVLVVILEPNDLVNHTIESDSFEHVDQLVRGLERGLQMGSPVIAWLGSGFYEQATIDPMIDQLRDASMGERRSKIALKSRVGVRTARVAHLHPASSSDHGFADDVFQRLTSESCSTTPG